MAYTREGIMAQIWVAFGQGTGTLRVTQEAVLVLHTQYDRAITDEIVNEAWDKEAVHILERIRAIGRLAALTAVSRGDSVINAEDVKKAIPPVQQASDTERCPPEWPF